MRMTRAMDARACWTQGCCSDDDDDDDLDDESVERNGGSVTDMIPVEPDEPMSPGKRRRREARDDQNALARWIESEHTKKVSIRMCGITCMNQTRNHLARRTTYECR